ncbi:MAG: hypothetical protein K2M16_03390, partial [Muribaculaceae bacterium]|nr:hypothetical protein [Muribaculaceae bacterium]
MDEKEMRPLPDCTNCAGCGGCGGGGCPSSEQEEAEGCGGCGSHKVMGWRREPRGKLYATNWLGDISTAADFPAVQVQYMNTRAG